MLAKDYHIDYSLVATLVKNTEGECRSAKMRRG